MRQLKQVFSDRYLLKLLKYKNLKALRRPLIGLHLLLEPPGSVSLSTRPAIKIRILQFYPFNLRDFILLTDQLPPWGIEGASLFNNNSFKFI